MWYSGRMPNRKLGPYGHWGEVASEAELPNVAGADIQKTSVNVGDTATIAGVLYICTDDTLGAAVWAAGGAGGRVQIQTANLTAASLVAGTGTITQPSDVAVGGAAGVTEPSFTFALENPSAGATLIMLVDAGLPSPLPPRFRVRFQLRTTTAGTEEPTVSLAFAGSGPFNMLVTTTLQAAAGAQTTQITEASGGAPGLTWDMPSISLANDVWLVVDVEKNAPFEATPNPPAVAWDVEVGSLDSAIASVSGRAIPSNPSSGALSGDWAGEDLDSIGLLLTWAGADAGTYTYVVAMSVEPHPKDV